MFLSPDLLSMSHSSSRFGRAEESGSNHYTECFYVPHASKILGNICSSVHFYITAVWIEGVPKNCFFWQTMPMIQMWVPNSSGLIRLWSKEKNASSLWIMEMDWIMKQCIRCSGTDTATWYFLWKDEKICMITPLLELEKCIKKTRPVILNFDSWEPVICFGMWWRPWRWLLHCHTS